MNKFGWVAATLIAAVMLFASGAAFARAPAPSGTDRVLEAIQGVRGDIESTRDAVGALRSEVNALQERVDANDHTLTTLGARSAAPPAAPAGSPTDLARLRAARVAQICRIELRGGLTQGSFQNLRAELAGLGSAGTPVPETCKALLQERYQQVFGTPAPPPPDIFRPVVGIGLQAADSTPVEFLGAVGIGNQTLEVQGLAGVTAGGHFALGADAALYPIPVARWLGFGGRATAIPTSLSESDATVIGGGPRLKFWLGPHLGNGAVEVGSLFGAAYLDDNPAKGEVDESVRFTAGGTAGLVWPL